MCEAKLSVCHGAVLSVVERYNCERQTPHRQRLVWRLSQRTLRRLRPTDRLVSTLPTIDEYGQLHIPPRHRYTVSFILLS
jgi:cyclin G2